MLALRQTFRHPGRPFCRLPGPLSWTPDRAQKWLLAQEDKLSPAHRFAARHRLDHLALQAHHVTKHTAFNYRFPVTAIREGWNEIIVINNSRERATKQERLANSIHIASIELAVN